MAALMKSGLSFDLFTYSRTVASLRNSLFKGSPEFPALCFRGTQKAFLRSKAPEVVKKTYSQRPRRFWTPFTAADLEPTVQDQQLTNNVISTINDQISQGSQGRLFAVIFLGGTQYKVTQDDMIVTFGHNYPDLGERIRLEKVMLLGSKDFTFIGRPLLSKDLVRVEATVIERTMSHLKTRFYFKAKKDFRHIDFQRTPYTILRINRVELLAHVNEKEEDERIEGIVPNLRNLCK